MSASKEHHHHHHHHHHHSTDDSKKKADGAAATSMMPPVRSFGLEIHGTLHQCAESHVYNATFCGVPAIVKHRQKKDYRHQVLDERIRNGRMVREARALARCARAGIPVPSVYFCDKIACSIVLEKIEGCTIREVFSRIADAFPAGVDARGKLVRAPEVAPDGSALISPAQVCHAILFKLGRIIAKLHLTNAIHGDLTTSNFMIRGAAEDVLPWVNDHHQRGASADVSSSSSSSSSEQQQQQQQQQRRNKNITENKGTSSSSSSSSVADGQKSEQLRHRQNMLHYDPEIIMIDFGLVQESSSLEDRAVDLYVLERAILSTHPTLANATHVVVEGYMVQLREATAAAAAAVSVGAAGAGGGGGGGSGSSTTSPFQQSTSSSHKPDFNNPSGKELADAVMDRLEVVRARGRKRSMIG